MSALREAIPRTPELEGQLLSLIAGGHTIAGAAARCFISGPLVHKWKKADPAFAERLAAARLANGGRFVRAQPTDPRAEREKRDRGRKGWCVDKTCGTCRSCTHRARALAWIAERGFVHGQHEDDWTPEQDALLRRMAGAHPTTAIARAVSAVGPPRTPAGVKMRAGRLDVGLYPTTARFTARDIARLLGASERKVARWLAGGDVPAVRGSALRTAEWSVQAADMERFLREQPWAYDPARLGRGRLADLGRVLHRADPWLPSRAAARWLGIERTTLQYHIGRGRLAAQRRTFGDSRVLVIRRSDVATFARELDALRARAAARVRDPRGRLLALADAS